MELLIILLLFLCFCLCDSKINSNGGVLIFKDLPKELEDSQPPNPFMPDN